MVDSTPPCRAFLLPEPGSCGWSEHAGCFQRKGEAGGSALAGAGQSASKLAAYRPRHDPGAGDFGREDRNILETEAAVRRRRRVATGGCRPAACAGAGDSLACGTGMNPWNAVQRFRRFARVCHRRRAGAMAACAGAGRAVLLAGGVTVLSGCAYVGTWAKQRYYAAQLRQSPRLHTSKHLLDRETFFVFGKVLGPELSAATPVAVLAVSPEPVRGEIVDVSESVRGGSYYGLNLPAGRYHLVAVADRDGDGFYVESEVIAMRALRLEAAAEEKVRGGYDIGERAGVRAVTNPFRIAVQPRVDPTPSLFYPKGTIRSLDDPIFSPQMATLGLYEPAAFMEAAPMMFYTLEEETGYKVPVIFVHGIGGSAREFEDIVNQLDGRRYRAWFFHYPSGGSLEQLGAMFYELFLSGNTIPRGDSPVVIVAHSMGGLVVREALNRWRGTEREAAIGGLVTIASPLGGHPAAARGVRAPVVIPSWRDLDPASEFVRGLHRAPLPDGLSYHLFYTFGDPRVLKRGEPSDGVVPVASQLAEPARREADEVAGFDCDHTGVLHDPAAMAAIVRAITAVKSTLPADHLAMFDRGGYDVALPEGEFSALEAYLVKKMGRYLDALAAGEIEPVHPLQVQFVEECAGRRPAEHPGAKAWIKLNRLYPRRAESGTTR